INMNRATRLMTDPSLAEGMGYSISSNIAAPVLHDIVNNYRMPAIGIGGRSLADDLENRAELWGIPALGVIILDVQQGRAAYNAGLREGDVITSFDGQPIFDMLQLQAAIRAKEIGDIVEMRILRGGSVAITVEVELAKRILEFF
ncbi:MAG: PDZ domain-containing protein, partial [Defluviitaleaceae bacterium]|nr:PDZ domain-containing protein [Defluviitaleaceae bacterium]